MRETSYGSTLADKIEREVGGHVIKIADKSTLGLPDNLHYKEGIATFFETKIGEERDIFDQDGITFCRPWASVNDLRQYEHCKKMSHHAAMLWVVYYPKAKMTCVLPIELLKMFRATEDFKRGFMLRRGSNFVSGHGVNVFKRITDERREKIYESLRPWTPV